MTDPGQPYMSPDDLSAITPLWQEAVEGELLPIVAEVFAATAGDIHSQLVDITDIPNLPSVSSAAAEAYLEQVGNTFDEIANDLWETARNELLDGFARGESIDQLANRVRSAGSLSAPTAVMVARTQIVEASNAGSLATARVSGLQLSKEWMATPDLRTRPAHRAADGQVVPLAETFTVGGVSADRPGDPSLPPELRYNCRCTIGYRMAEAAARQARRDAEPEPVLPNTAPSPPPQTAPLGPSVGDVVDDENVTVDELAPVFNVSFPSGLRTELTNLVRQPRGPLDVWGIIVDHSGQKVGTFQRTLGRDGNGHLYAEHAYLKLDETVRAGGFATQFNHRLYDWYRQGGVQRVQLSTAWEGGYVWARAGFDWATEESAEGIRPRLRDRLDTLRRHRKQKIFNRPPITLLSATDLDDQIRAAELFLDRWDAATFGSPDYPTPFELSELGRRPGQAGRDEMWLGKWVMLDSFWDGVMWL